MISCFDNIKIPIVKSEIDIYEYIEQIKRPEQPILDKINKARFHHTDKKYLYDEIKAQLPCFTLNFSFNERKTNTNIKAPTGFIYLDLDNKTEIELTNELIFVSWKSLSNTGRGILVKVKGLTIANFKSTYLSIAKELNIKADKNASKPTQYCIHSYDKDIYVNDNSITWICKEEIINNTPITELYLNKKRKDNTELGEFQKLRFNNIDDFNFEDKEYLYFKDEKISIANVFIPKRISQGGRNNIISSIANQIKVLNPKIPFDDFRRLINSINYKHCKPLLKDDEMQKIIEKVFYSKDLKLILNKERRILFNPKYEVSVNEKRKIINQLNGKRRSEKTKRKIEQVLLNWNYNKQGKITQKSLQKVTGMNIKTIEKYYRFFKRKVEMINSSYSERIKLLLC